MYIYINHKYTKLIKIVFALLLLSNGMFINSLLREVPVLDVFRKTGMAPAEIYLKETYNYIHTYYECMYVCS